MRASTNDNLIKSKNFKRDILLLWDYLLREHDSNNFIVGRGWNIY
jgi:hypothetical protein